MKTPLWLRLFAVIYMALMIFATPKVYKLPFSGIGRLPMTQTRIACFFHRPMIVGAVDKAPIDSMYKFESLSPSWLLAYAAFSLCGGILLAGVAASKSSHTTGFVRHAWTCFAKDTGR